MMKRRPQRLPKVFALDTEDDVYEDTKRTKLIQICSVDATSIDQVELFYGFDAWSQFFDCFESQTGKGTLKCHCYNLGGYEFSHMMKEVLETRYTLVDYGKPQEGEWSLLADQMTVYELRIVSRSGKKLIITDDLRRFNNMSMKEVATAIRLDHPEWWKGLDEVKEESDYHAGWLDESDPKFEQSLHYSILDAYSQAMISRWWILQGYGDTLTSASMGLNVFLKIHYHNKGFESGDYLGCKFARGKFIKEYPPLTREMQDIAERSITGGLVYGLVGTHKGTFVHLDYSSSYPYEYAFGNMFKGKVERMLPTDPLWDRYCKKDRLKWYVVSFDFKLKDGYIPVLTGRDCMIRNHMNEKMKEGSVESRLYTATYLEELKHSYEIRNFKIEEMWWARRNVGICRDFIEYCYTKKSDLKAQGLKDGALYLVNKTAMNGGAHGKTITKTHRKKRSYDVDGKVFYIDEINDPQYNFLIGFTAMMNAKERLVRHCRLLTEAGKTVYMCDTDSVVTNCTEEETRAIIGDWFVKGKALEDSLGRFEVEDKDGVKEFNEFRCWGLKRYLELENGKYRKSAFAGMNKEIQKTMLMDWKTDGTEYCWEQRGRKAGRYGAVVCQVEKHAAAEDIWYHEHEKHFTRGERFDDVYREIKERMLNGLQQ